MSFSFVWRLNFGWLRVGDVPLFFWGIRASISAPLPSSEFLPGAWIGFGYFSVAAASRQENKFYKINNLELPSGKLT